MVGLDSGYSVVVLIILDFGPHVLDEVRQGVNSIAFPSLVLYLHHHGFMLTVVRPSDGDGVYGVNHTGVSQHQSLDETAVTEVLDLHSSNENRSRTLTAAATNGNRTDYPFANVQVAFPGFLGRSWEPSANGWKRLRTYAYAFANGISHSMLAQLLAFRGIFMGSNRVRVPCSFYGSMMDFHASL